MMVCNSCGAAYNDGAKFCGRCGAGLTFGQTPQYTSGYSVPNAPGCELYKYNQLVVGELYHGLKADSKFVIYATDGTKVGSIVQSPVSKSETVARLAVGKRGSKMFFASSYAIYNEREEYVGAFCQDGFTRQMFDQYNRLIGSITKGGLQDVNGQLVVRQKFNTIRSLDAFYLDGRKFAAITKGWNGARQLFVDMDKYLIEFDPEANEMSRLIGIEYCICLELLH